MLVMDGITLVNKAMIEVLPKFAGKPSVNADAKPLARHSGESRNPRLDPGVRRGDELFAREGKGAQGRAEDVRYYGQWLRDEACRKTFPRHSGESRNPALDPGVRRGDQLVIPGPRRGTRNPATAPRISWIPGSALVDSPGMTAFG